MSSITPDTQEMLDSLRTAVTNTLERKRRLGHYAVVWQDGKPMRLHNGALDFSMRDTKSDSQKR